MLPDPPNTTEDLTLSWLMARAYQGVRLLWAERRTILRLVILAAGLGLVDALGSGEEYSATTRILPYRSASGSAAGVGGLSGLAGLAGVRFPGGAGEQTITADLYPEVFGTQDFRIAVAETPLRFGTVPRKVTIVEYFRDIRTLPLTELLARYTIGMPGRLLALARGTIGTTSVARDSTASAESDEGPALPTYDHDYLLLVSELEDRLTISVDRKTSVITITGLMPDAYASADLVRVTSNQLMDRIIAYESRKAGEQFRFVNAEYERAKDRFERAQRDLAQFADRNRSLMSAISRIEQDRLQRAYDVAFEVFQQFSREMEQARIKMNQDTPVFTVIEQVTVPTDRASPRRVRIILLSLFLGAVAGVLWVGGRILVLRAAAIVRASGPR